MSNIIIAKEAFRRKRVFDRLSKMTYNQLDKIQTKLRLNVGYINVQEFSRKRDQWMIINLMNRIDEKEKLQ